MDSITRGNLVNKGSISNVGVQTLTRIFIVGGNSEVVWGQSAAERRVSAGKQFNRQQS
nr:hypothetical protein BN993_06379 [Virgibacillus halodenitrificans]